MSQSELLFVIEEEDDGGFVARAVGESIVTEADDFDSLRDRVRDAVILHFNQTEQPKLIRLHLVRDEVLVL